MGRGRGLRCMMGSCFGCEVGVGIMEFFRLLAFGVVFIAIDLFPWLLV